MSEFNLGVRMLQPHLFFLSPQAYFGPVDPTGEEDLEETDLLESYCIPLDLQFHPTEKNPSGLFLNWSYFPVDFS